MGHDHDEAPADDAASWDAMYAEKPTVWSGEPNSQLVAEVSDLPPGRALDVGCGEGADAVWLAQHGWTVDAVDISVVALDRAQAHSKALDVEISFMLADLINDPPAPNAYDLVSVQFFHLSDPPRSVLMRSLGEAVTPAGHLLIVGHHFDDVDVDDEHAHMRDRIHTVDDMLELFADWAVETAETRQRWGMHRGEMTAMVDTVVLLRRIS